jgi:hypothetical protein
MTRRMPLFVVLIAAVCVLSGCSRSRTPSRVVTAFGRLPVLSEGRIKPLDSVARSTLLVIQGRQRVVLPDGSELTPDEWLLDVFLPPEKADDLPGLRRRQHRPALADRQERGQPEDPLREHGEQVDGAHRDRPEQPAPDVVQRDRALPRPDRGPGEAGRARRGPGADPLPVGRHPALRQPVPLPEAAGGRSCPTGSTDFLGELLTLQENLAEGVEAVRAKEAGKPHDEAKAAAIIDEGQKFVAMAESTDLLAIPPDGDDPTPTPGTTRPRAPRDLRQGRGEPVGARLRRDGLRLAQEPAGQASSTSSASTGRASTSASASR